MAVSGSFDYELDVIEYLEEAYESCGKVMRSAYDIKSGMRSLNLLFADWANRGLNQWTIEQVTVTMVSGTSSYSLGADTVDITNASLRRSGTDYSLERLSRPDFLNIPNKTTTGRVTQYFCDRQIIPTLEVWPVPDNSTDGVVYNRLRRIDDADTPSDTVGIPFRFYPALAAGLAFFLSIKFAQDRTPLLKQVYDDLMKAAMEEDRDRAPLVIVPMGGY